MIPKDSFSRLFYHTSLLGCLLGLAATLYFLAGVSGHIGSTLLNISTASFLFLGALFFLYIFFFLLPEKSRLGTLIWFLILLVLLAEVVLGLVPPTARDELTHHLAIPRIYVKSGRIFEIPFAPYSYYPMLLDMLYTPFIKWGWDSVPKFIHGLFGFLTGLLLYAYLSRRLSSIYGLLGFLFFISTPVVLRLSNLGYVDLGLTFYSTASLLCLLRWRETATSSGWLILAGLLAGFALSTKPNSFLVFFLLTCGLVFTLSKTKQKSSVKELQCIVLFLCSALIAFSPWVVKNFIQTGNPFFPFFGSLFSGGAGGIGGGIGAAGSGFFTRREMLYGESWLQIVALPFRIFISGQDDNPQYFDGVLTPILILFLPWAFRGKWVEEKRLLFSFSLLYLLYAIFLVDMRIRYILPIVPPLVILTVYGIHNIYMRIVNPSFLFAVIVALIALNGVYLWRYFDKVSPVDYLLANESREVYLTRMLPEYPALQYINQDLPAEAKVYFLFVGRRVYYSKRDYFHDAGDNAWILLRIIQNAQSKDAIKLSLRNQGLTHLLAREDLLNRFLTNNLNSEQLRRWSSFARLHLQPLFRARGYSVYQIHG